MPAVCQASRQRPTFQQQLQISSVYHKNKDTLQISNIVGLLRDQGFSTICRKTVLRYASNEDTIRQYIGEDVRNGTLTRHRSGALPALERQLYEWIRKKERNGLRLNGYLIREKGRRLAHEHNIGHTVLHNFSDGWLTRFKQRFGIKQYTFHGEAASAPIAELESHKRTIKEALSRYLKDAVFNVDETAHLISQSPESGLASQALPGVKADKTRLTYVLGTSAAGEKLLPFVIGHAARPRCFTNGPPSDYGYDYASNKNAWMKSDLWQAYLDRLNEQMASQGRRILLLCNNASSHKHDPARTPNIEVYHLPPNLTAWIQPMDAGIIRNFKSNYRRLHTKFVLDREATGVLNPYKVHQLDAMRLSQQAWEEVSASSIQNCWRHTGILPELWEVEHRLANIAV
ncbi:Tigger transposable element-derived protein 6 [Homo sapiens] [Rhizoctonia solani]|uniref:Tigger transposable element-derived protein 6 [Homo sapiens] n=1 Tax=Rhizoctonia solani TaxID=456999 RepID=A0A0K6G1W6_9AGAM|nr:Tigger transposable element-derived protein 6 [Homo sapiens] [Rhizoctonia solani]